MKIIGLILIIIGLAMLIMRGFQYTEKEKVLDAGPIEITKKEQKVITWPYYAGAVSLITGIILVLVDRKKR